MSIDTAGPFDHIDITDDYLKGCALCLGRFEYRAYREPYPGAFQPVAVGEVYVHDRCQESYRAKTHLSHLTREQKARVEANRAPWVIGPAIRDFEWGRWFEFKTKVMQVVWDFWKGLR